MDGQTRGLDERMDIWWMDRRMYGQKDGLKREWLHARVDDWEV